MGYNQPLHRLNIFSLSDREFISQFFKALMDPTLCDTPFDFFIHKPDSIFFIACNFIGISLTNWRIVATEFMCHQVRNVFLVLEAKKK